MPLWHLTWSSAGRFTLFTDEAQLRAATRLLCRSAGPAGLLFCLVDDHVHLVVDTEAAPALASGIQRGLRRLAAAPLQPVHRTPVDSRSHLDRLVAYCCRQASKHGLQVHPALWSGSCLPDLTGARQLPGFDPKQLLRHLPRFQPRQALYAAGLEVDELTPASDELVATLGAQALKLAAAAAIGQIDLHDRRSEVLAVRRAAVQLGVRAGVPRQALESAFDLQPRAVRRDRAHDDDERMQLTIRRRLTLDQLATRTSTATRSTAASERWPNAAAAR